MTYWVKSLGILCFFGCDMPMVAQPLHKLPTHTIMFFLRELPKVCGPFFDALAVRAMVV
jgi:hypothetical protein